VQGNLKELIYTVSNLHYRLDDVLKVLLVGRYVYQCIGIDKHTAPVGIKHHLSKVRIVNVAGLPGKSHQLKLQSVWLPTGCDASD